MGVTGIPPPAPLSPCFAPSPPGGVGLSWWPPSAKSRRAGPGCEERERWARGSGSACREVGRQAARYVQPSRTTRSCTALAGVQMNAHTPSNTPHWTAAELQKHQRDFPLDPPTPIDSKTAIFHPTLEPRPGPHQCGWGRKSQGRQMVFSGPGGTTDGLLSLPALFKTIGLGWKGLRPSKRELGCCGRRCPLGKAVGKSGSCVWLPRS